MQRVSQSRTYVNAVAILTYANAVRTSRLRAAPGPGLYIPNITVTATKKDLDAERLDLGMCHHSRCKDNTPACTQA